MDSFADFIASAVEFLVGGVLFSLALLVLLNNQIDVNALSQGQVDLLAANSSLLFFIGIAIAYAVGVAAESMARWSFEWLLDRITVRTPQFLPERIVLTQAASAVSWYVRLRDGFVSACLGGQQLVADGPRVPFTIADRTAARDEREKQRSTVMTWHVSLYDDVQAQLKRLRLERVMALSLLVTTGALVWRSSWTAAGWSFVGLVVVSILVHARFGRYCKSIRRGYERVSEDKLRQTSGAVITSQPGLESAHEGGAIA